MRLVSPKSGNVLTTLLMPPKKILVDAAYAIAQGAIVFALCTDAASFKGFEQNNECISFVMQIEHIQCSDLSRPS